LLFVTLLRRFDLTWGPIEYHRRSLDNLQTAMKKSRKLCAIVLDTLGREVRVIFHLF
jgi:pyruvate kinase